ncbi:pentatricopeptide repeat-containing protein [Tanacetum coccineum]
MARGKRLLVVIREGMLDDIEDESCYDTYKTKSFNVFGYDLGNENWSNLGAKTLFVGYSSSFWMDDDTGVIKGNCIYYKDDVSELYGGSKIGGERDLGIYHLSDGTIESHFTQESTSLATPPIRVRKRAALSVGDRGISNGFLGTAQNMFYMEALELFREMQMEGDVTPNYNWIKDDIPMLGSALIDMYSKCGSIEEALQLFESLSQKNVITWNSIITGLAIHGRAKDALDHFTKMQESGISPNDVTYISVLTACSHAGLLYKGMSIFDQIVSTDGQTNQGLSIKTVCMVDLLVEQEQATRG